MSLIFDKVLPTCTCFDDAIDRLEEMLMEQQRDPADFVIVHAIALAPEGTAEAGRRFAHAWLEEGNLAHQDGWVEDKRRGRLRITYTVEVAELRRELRVQREVRYTVQQALALNVTHGHYGPWDFEIAGLAVPRGQGKVFYPTGE